MTHQREQLLASAAGPYWNGHQCRRFFSLLGFTSGKPKTNHNYQTSKRF
jgi:hypothetical protein